MVSILDQLDRFGPQHCETLSLQQADRYAAELARTHYENFTVASALLPKRLVADFQRVYGFCRWADDLGDETGDAPRSVELLQWWRGELDLCYQGRPRHPIFVALGPTIEKHGIPRKPFDDLIDAFLQDQRVSRYETWGQTLDYCDRSANPVGRLVLYLCGYADAHRQRLSDATCTALQLVNFWQDVRPDVLNRDRVYLPQDVALKHGLDIETMVRAIRWDADEVQGAQQAREDCAACVPATDAALEAIRPAFRATMRELCDRTAELFDRGKELWPLVERDVRLDIRLFSLGGEAVLRKIHRQGHDTLRRRPKVGKLGKLWLLVWAWLSNRMEPFEATSPPAAEPRFRAVADPPDESAAPALRRTEP